ncbi:IS256 family transposase [Legionella yabuuchiae]|uniref:IS256 family transposase n=1 Tax=Legionella yabuuchiae TaxID=376727 RepID=UPI001055F78C|nr:IS256 family transposase [Legionella yabuuchiae]
MIKPQDDISLTSQLLELLSGEDGAIGRALELVFNQAMLLERQRHLNASAYERSDERTGYANGFKPKSLKTRSGVLELKVPQTRDGFYPSCIDKGLRSERALKVSLAEMYLQGVSTRKMAAITEKLCGFEITSSDVSRLTKELDDEFERWRNRPLGKYRYLWLDARYEKVRHDGHIIDCAVLVAKGVNEEGKREILGVSVSLSEAEVHWRNFLQSLLQRGLHGLELIISDAHKGLRAARRSIFSGVSWQRCQFHLQQNAQAYVNSLKQRAELGEKIRDIFNAASLSDAERLLKAAVEHYSKGNPKLAEWLEQNIPEGFAVFSGNIPKNHRKRLRTTNPLERLNREIKRRTRTACLFPNEAACLRLVTAVVMETSEEWLLGKTYLALQ